MKKMKRPMYQASRPRNDARIKVTDITIEKRKKVLNFLQGEEIIAKNKNGYCPKICKFYFATDSLKLVSTDQQLTFNL
jgi:hypothetical protein